MFENSFVKCDTRVAVFLLCTAVIISRIIIIITNSYSDAFGGVLRTCHMYVYTQRRSYNIYSGDYMWNVIIRQKPVNKKKKKTFVGCKVNGFGRNSNIILLDKYAYYIIYISTQINIKVYNIMVFIKNNKYIHQQFGELTSFVRYVIIITIHNTLLVRHRTRYHTCHLSIQKYKPYTNAW